jgi:hypothetical protein
MVLKEFELSRKYFLLARFIGVQYPPLEGELKGEEECFFVNLFEDKTLRSSLSFGQGWG